MSYDIIIGNATLESDWPGEDGVPSAKWVAEMHSEPNAPTFAHDDQTGNGNCRSPGYTQWADFCRTTALDGMFYGPEGVLRTHPGCVVLTPAMFARVGEALATWLAEHPRAVPGWDYNPVWHSEPDDGVRGRDPILARLIWLNWWMDWALTNCERPAISNR